MSHGALAVWLAGFRLDRCGWDPRVPAVLVAAERGAERLQAVSPVAASGGLKVGMTLAEARSHLPELHVERLDRAGEERDLRALAQHLQRFSPIVEAVPPDALVLDVRPDAMAPVRAALADLGHACRLVWAEEPQAALLLARFGERDRVLPRSELRAALAPLPVRALDLPEAVLDALADVGIRTVGAFAGLPAPALTGRYGQAVGALHALARGEAQPAPRPLPPDRPETALSVDLPDPVDSLDALLFVLNGLVRDLCLTLDELPVGAVKGGGEARGGQGAAIVRVHVRLRLEEGELCLPIRLGRPGRSPDRLFRLLRARLERVQLPSPVVAVQLELVDAAPFRPAQPGLHDRADAAEPLPDLLARLQDALGEEIVCGVEDVDTHLPEAAWRAVPVGDEVEVAGDGPAAGRPARPDPAGVHEPIPELGPRPALLLPVSVPLRVATAPSGRPRAVHLAASVDPSRPGRPDWIGIVETEGPERLIGAWWGSRSFARDYWRVRLEDGRRAWIYRDDPTSAEGAAGEGATGEAARWWLHGWFDQEAPGIELRSALRVRKRAAPRYAELICRSNYSFCEGASHPAELVAQARSLGLEALAITDRDGLYGAVQAHRAAREHGVPLIHGALLTVGLPSAEAAAGPLFAVDEPRAWGGAGREAAPPPKGTEGPGASLVCLVQSRRGWASLCRLLTAARLGGARLDDVLPPPDLDGLPEEVRARAEREGAPPPAGALHVPGGVPIEKGWSRLPFADLLADNEGLVLLARGDWPADALADLRDVAGDRLYRAVSRRLGPDEPARIEALARGYIPAVAVGDVLLHHRDRQALQDVLTCIRLGTTLGEAGRRLQPNAERVLADAERMARRFAPWPELLDRTLEIRSRCDFSLDELEYRYPKELVPEGYDPMQWLTELVRRGARIRYPSGVPAAVEDALRHELRVIGRLQFANYFLTVADMVRFARERGILCQGRGSAANSAVCFVLGVTSVDPASTSLLFERFLSEERGEPPDIDVDFEHERREEVMQYVYEKYGRARAAMVNEVIAWRGKMAVRDVGRALGYGPDQVDQLAKTMGAWGEGKLSAERLREAGCDPGDPMLQHLASLVEQIQGFPRHTSIHVGGFVVSDDPLVDLAPIEPARMPGRTVLQWDKNDVDDLHLVKVDLLSLGMLTAIRKCFTLMRTFHGVSHDLASVPKEDPAVYDMLCAADSIGVFQVESRAQQSMLPRLRPRCFYDLVVETAIVRPGPIQGGMVHPYLRRRAGEEPITYADPRLVPILGRTMGVPIFQEQVMAMAIAVGGFTPGEADSLRRAMGAWRKRGGLEAISAKLLRGLRANGIREDYAEQILKQIQGFAEYGFPESHAASFAHLVYVSSWQRCHYLAAFCAALINSQPMGFYAPRSLIADAQRHGVEVREVDATVSGWDCSLEPALAGGGAAAIRLGLRMVKGLSEASALRVEEERRAGPYRSIADLADRTRLSEGDLRLLARADALRSLLPGGADAGQGERVREAVWAVEGLWPGLFTRVERREEQVPLPLATPLERIQAAYAATGLSVDEHPVSVARPRLARQGYTPLARLIEVPTGTVVRVAGLVSHRQRPATASGVVFMTLEDETGTGNIVVWPKVYERQRALIRGEKLLTVSGKLERQGEVLNVIAWRFGALDLAGRRAGDAPGEPRPTLRASSRDFR